MKIFFSIIISVFLFIQVATAQSSEVFAPSGIAINGYDPVAFFIEGKPLKGLSEFSCKWKNVRRSLVAIVLMELHRGIRLQPRLIHGLLSMKNCILIIT